MNKKGFTLVELIIVVIVIGILATIAIPQYMKAVERARVGKAKSMCGLIMQAEKMYSAENGGNYTASMANLQNYMEVVTSDGDWTYSCTTTPTAIAQRTAGVPTYGGMTVILDASGSWATGTHTLD